MSQNDDLISRQAAIDAVRELYIQSPKINNDIVYDTAIDQAHDALVNLPSAQPYTDEEIQVMQDLEQAQLDKAYELGWKEGREALRQAAIDAIEILLEQSEDDEHDKTWNNAIRGSINAVKHHVPSAQPEIVRCKECVYADENYHCDYMTTWNYGDCFCSYGKRRTDGRSNQ